MNENEQPCSREELEAWLSSGEFRNQIFRQCFSRIGRREDSEDVCAEVIARAWERFAQFKGTTKKELWSWCFTTLIHTCSNFFRRQSRRHSALNPETEAGQRPDTSIENRSFVEDYRQRVKRKGRVLFSQWDALDDQICDAIAAEQDSDAEYKPHYAGLANTLNCSQATVRYRCIHHIAPTMDAVRRQMEEEFQKL